MSKIKNFLANWGPAMLMMAIIFAFSATPERDLPNFEWADLLVKKGGHMLGYGLLALTFLRGFRERAGENYRTAGIAWGFTVIYAMTDEFHQSFVPGRHPSFLDVGIDSLGAAILLFLWLRYGVRNKLIAEKR